MIRILDVIKISRLYWDKGKCNGCDIHQRRRKKNRHSERMSYHTTVLLLLYGIVHLMRNVYRGVWLLLALHTDAL